VYVAVSRASQAVTLEASAPGADPSSRADQQLWRDWLGPDC
jgi:exodeoxyribonuclease V